MIDTLNPNLLFWFNQTMPHPEWLTGFFVFLDRMFYAGGFWVVFCLMMMLSTNEKHKKFGKWGLVSLVFTSFIEGVVLKNLIRWPRPFWVLENIKLFGIKPISYSFPSGHVAVTAAMTVLFWLMFPKTKNAWLLILITGLVSISRLYLGVHYPTDVLGGLVIGSACGWAVFKLSTRVS